MRLYFIVLKDITDGGIKNQIGHDYGQQHLNFAIETNDATMKRFLMDGLKKIQLSENISHPSSRVLPQILSLSFHLSHPTSSLLNPIKLTSQGYNANGVPKRKKTENRR